MSLNITYGETRRALLDLTGIVEHHLLKEGFKLDGTDPIADISDEVLSFILDDHSGYARFAVDNAYDLVGSYDEMAEIITENLA